MAWQVSYRQFRSISDLEIVQDRIITAMIQLHNNLHLELFLDRAMDRSPTKKPVKLSPPGLSFYYSCIDMVSVNTWNPMRVQVCTSIQVIFCSFRRKRMQNSSQCISLKTRIGAMSHHNQSLTHRSNPFFIQSTHNRLNYIKWYNIVCH